jgi:hypothetical protein
VRHFVGASRRSGQRRQGLEATIIEGNEKQSWPKAIVPTQLVSDMEVRWSSTHFMIQRIIELFPVSSEYQCSDSRTHLVQAIQVWMGKPEQIELRQQHSITQADIAVLKDIMKITTHFQKVQALLSLERMPTLCYVLAAYESLIIQLEESMRKPSGRHIAHAYQAAIDKINKYQSKCRENPIYSVSMGELDINSMYNN